MGKDFLAVLGTCPPASRAPSPQMERSRQRFDQQASSQQASSLQG
jgi:hypothetical protein